MKKIRILITAGIIAALLVPFSVFAATSDSSVAKTVRGFFGIDFSKLSDQQKADVNTYSQKMAELQKEFVDKMVSNGTMTKEQGDAEKSRIDKALKASQDNGNAYGYGMGKGFFNGNEKHAVPGKNIIDTSKLTDQQKADLKETETKMLELQKEYIDKAVSFGLLTQDQGDKLKSRLDAAQSTEKSADSSLRIMPGRGGFGLFGSNGADQSKLTDQQKAELANYSKEMAELQKEMINKLTADGVMTKEEGDAAIKRIDAMSESGAGKGFPKGFGKMGRGRSNPSALPEKSDTVSNSETSL